MALNVILDIAVRKTVTGRVRSDLHLRAPSPVLDAKHRTQATNEMSISAEACIKCQRTDLLKHGNAGAR
jgi:hypothetical protein